MEREVKPMELKIRELFAAYGRREVLRELSFTVPEGSFTAIIGRNGSGKSTLVSCLAGLHPYRGEITVGGRSLSLLRGRERARTLSLLPQQIRAPHITVEELVRFGRSPYLSLGGSLTDTDRERIEQAITKAELLSLRRRYVDTLSGGERRRAYLGMTLAQDAPILLLDEPTANMDLCVEAQFWQIVQSLGREKGKTAVAVMHNLGDAVRFADRIVLLEGGTLRFSGTTEAFLSTTLAEDVMGVHRYTTSDGVFFVGA